MKYLISFALLLVVLLCGCSGVYYSTMEKIGVHKRDILVDRVVEARDSQAETKERFSSALERFTSVINFSGGELEEKYKQLSEELKKSEEQADDVRNRVAAVEDVAGALFDEWEDELDQYKNTNLKRKSEAQLKQTRRHYLKLIGAMKKLSRKSIRFSTLCVIRFYFSSIT